MTKDEVLQLGELARIKLTDAEVEQFLPEIDAILAYVSTINEVVSDGSLQKKVGPVFNVFREDEVTTAPESCTEVLLEAMPLRDGRYLKVKKILNPDA